MDESKKPPRSIDVGTSAAIQEETDEMHINRLPCEILQHIFEMMYVKQQLKCRLVCVRWYKILRSEPFMSRYVIQFPHTWGRPLEEHLQARIDGYPNCIFHDNGSLEGQDDDIQPGAHCSGGGVPGPSTIAPGPIVDDFIFNEGRALRSLELRCSFDRMRRYVGDRLKNLPNLQELILVVCEEHNKDLKPETVPWWAIRHPTLRSIMIHLLDNTNGYVLHLPMVDEIAMGIANDFDLRALMTHSPQLRDVEVKFFFDRAMEQTLTCSFPKLKRCLLWRKNSANPNAIPDPNTRGDDMSAERFVKGAPLLEDVSLYENGITYRLFRAVCLFAPSTMTRLYIYNVNFPRSLFELILHLQQLQYLRLRECKIMDGKRLREVNLPNLRHLNMIKSGTCLRIDAGLSNVRRFRYSMDSRLSKLCRHMLMLEDLEIKLRTDAPVAEDIRKHFHSLPLLPNLRTLRLTGIRTYTRPWDFCRPMPAVEHLVLRKSHFLRCHFRHLPQLFPSLKVLELQVTCIGYKRVPKGVDPLEHFKNRLKEFLPSCFVRVDVLSTAEPLATVLEMEDEFQWHYNILRKAGVRVFPHLDVKVIKLAE